ncbi:MAG TPA: ATP-grasp domain-containing protein, partial [Anaerolineae bacterium]|nr:ATP-grasp domain-containing protein [Anaerolineae bacterium]
MRVLLLTTPHTYRAQAFRAAAQKLGVDIVTALDLPGELGKPPEAALALDFRDPEQAVQHIVAYAHDKPLAAILSVDDSASLIAAEASVRLGLPHNSPQAAQAARDKFVMRTLLKQGGVRVPNFQLFSTADDLAQAALRINYPCVVKPLTLNGSRGVIRADNAEQFVAAAQRLSRLLHSIEPTPDPKPFLSEDFIPGCEVALEGLLDHGELKVLALFDKPDPLDGPFFEETLYVTPSRLPVETQDAITHCTAESAKALGLSEGPVHAELRINGQGPWLVELAGRSIGGLCSQTLRFAHGADVSLEELILRQALGLEIDSLEQEGRSGGVMMIPIPGEGLLRGVAGIEDAKAVIGIEDVQITAKLNYPLVPLPEGESYLGFIFARGATPLAVETALWEAHAKLHFDIQPIIPLITI